MQGRSEAGERWWLPPLPQLTPPEHGPTTHRHFLTAHAGRSCAHPLEGLPTRLAAPRDTPSRQACAWRPGRCWVSGISTAAHLALPTNAERPHLIPPPPRRQNHHGATVALRPLPNPFIQGRHGVHRPLFAPGICTCRREGAPPPSPFTQPRTGMWHSH